MTEGGIFTDNNCLINWKLSYFCFPKYSIKLLIPEIIQDNAMMIKTTFQLLETSTTKIKVYKANTLNNKQIIVVIAFTFVRLSTFQQPPLILFILSYFYALVNV